MTIEDDIETKVVHEAELAGWFVRKLGWVGRTSAPDRLFIKKGRVVFIEFKAPGKDANPTQAKEHDRMRDKGAEVYVCDSIREALAILRVYGWQ